MVRSSLAFPPGAKMRRVTQAQARGEVDIARHASGLDGFDRHSVKSTPPPTIILGPTARTRAETRVVARVGK
jgi:hypothetical protein